LIKLEPLVTYDESDARFDLITVATNPEVSEWTRAARYTWAWLASGLGRFERASSAYGRLLIDAPLSPAAARASVGLAVLRMRDGDGGDAVRMLQHAIDREAPAELHAAALRELAVRLVLDRAGAGRALVKAFHRPSTAIKSLAGMATTPDGVLLADGRDGSIVALGGRGTVAGKWSVEAVKSVTVDPLGRIFAANEDGVYRLRPGGSADRIAVAGAFASPLSMAAESSGRIWMLDRKGESLGTIEPGTTAPLPIWSEPGRKLSMIHWDGRRLLAIDPKNKTLLAFGADGRPSPLPARALLKPVARTPESRSLLPSVSVSTARYTSSTRRPPVGTSCNEEHDEVRHDDRSGPALLRRVVRLMGAAGCLGRDHGPGTRRESTVARQHP